MYDKKCVNYWDELYSKNEISYNVHKNAIYLSCWQVSHFHILLSARTPPSPLQDDNISSLSMTTELRLYALNTIRVLDNIPYCITLHYGKSYPSLMVFTPSLYKTDTYGMCRNYCSPLQTPLLLVIIAISAVQKGTLT